MNKLFNNIFLFTLLICNGYTTELLECSSINNIENHGILVDNDQLDSINKIDSSNSSNKDVKILSLDGGGTRGYVQAKFLELFCNDAKIKNLGECFDVIAGTSVGGLNAVACANGLSPDYMMDFFREKSPWIFTIRSKKDIFSNNASYSSYKPNKIQMLYMMGISNPFYKAVSSESNYGEVRLKREIYNIVEDRLLTSLKTNVLLTAHNYSEYAPVVFTNANIEGIPNTFKEVKIVDALMATTSAPVYFPSTKLKLSPDPNEPAYNIIDGGLFQNNPSSLAFSAAKKLYPNATSYSLLSIGTGINKIGLHVSSKEAEPSNSSVIKYTKLFNITMENSQIDNDLLFKVLSNNKNYNVSYYRFNIQLDSNRDCSFDTSTSDFFDYLDDKVIVKYQEEHDKINQFINKLKGVNE